jgi:hypothetical protein
MTKVLTALGLHHHGFPGAQRFAVIGPEEEIAPNTLEADFDGLGHQVSE